MNNIRKFLIYLLLLNTIFDLVHAQILNIDGHSLHYQSWNTAQKTQRPTIVLLSGPIDSWHSDSAWWAALAPELANTYRVIALDRTGLVLGTPNAKVGYQHFAQDLASAFAALQIKDALVVAFVSSNISVQLFLAEHPEQQAIKQVIMIDPDVLTDFSIARYQHDAAQFKQNLNAYSDYIKEGKYTARTAPKKASDLEQLKTLSVDANLVGWAYVEKLQQARLEIVNQVNLFNEIAIYDEDLDAVAKSQWPATVPLVLIDTDFEAEYIDKEQDEAQKAGLMAWQQDAVKYYQSITKLHPDSRYIASMSRAHLYQFAEMKKLFELINQLNKQGSIN